MLDQTWPCVRASLVSRFVITSYAVAERPCRPAVFINPARLDADKQERAAPPGAAPHLAYSPIVPTYASVLPNSWPELVAEHTASGLGFDAVPAR